MNVLIFFSGVFIAVPLLAAWVIDRMWLAAGESNVDE